MTHTAGDPSSAMTTVGVAGKSGPLTYESTIVCGSRATSRSGSIFHAAKIFCDPIHRLTPAVGASGNAGDAHVNVFGAPGKSVFTPETLSSTPYAYTLCALPSCKPSGTANEKPWLHELIAVH